MESIVVLEYEYPANQPYADLLKPQVMEKFCPKHGVHLKRIPSDNSGSAMQPKAYTSVYHLEPGNSLSSFVGAVHGAIHGHFGVSSRTQLPAHLPENFVCVAIFPEAERWAWSALSKRLERIT